MLQNSKRTFIEFVNLLFTTITTIHFSNSKSLVNLYFIAWAGPGARFTKTLTCNRKRNSIHLTLSYV